MASRRSMKRFGSQVEVVGWEYIHKYISKGWSKHHRYQKMTRFPVKGKKKLVCFYINIYIFINANIILI